MSRVKMQRDIIAVWFVVVEVIGFIIGCSIKEPDVTPVKAEVQVEKDPALDRLGWSSDRFTPYSDRRFNHIWFRILKDKETGQEFLVYEDEESESICPFPTRIETNRTEKEIKP